MFRALNVAATGMEAQSKKIDNISNNLANVNTTGFKRTRADFEDLMYQNLRAAGAAQGGGVVAPVGLQVGHGVRNVSTSRMFSQGEMLSTGNAMDLAIGGKGFLQVAMPNGTQAFTRAGNLTTDQQGRVVTTSGYPVVPEIIVPPDATGVTISQTGEVTVTQGNGETAELGQIQLSGFANEAGLSPIGQNLYVPTQSSGQPIQGQPGQLGMGTLNQGFLEGSNVQVVEEMINLIVAQRSYETTSKVVEAADEMLQYATQMVR
jgi:flagellar basal-body rod protein FlgG